MKAFATGAIGAGELCTLFESGAVKRTDPTLPWSAINQNDSTPVVIQESVVVEDIVLTGMTVFKGVGYAVRLINETFVVPLQTPNGIGFCVRNSSGEAITEFIQVSTDASTDRPYVLVLANGNFVLIWHVSATLKFCVIEPNGTLVSAVITVSTTVVVAGSVPWHGHCQLVNGNFVITWSTTGGAFQAQIFTVLGATVGSLIAIDSITGQWHACVPCANGDFLAACFDGTHHKLYRVTASGAVSWGPHTPSGCSGALFTNIDGARMHPARMRLQELTAPSGFSNPNICWMLPNTSGYCNAFIIAFGGADVAQCDPGNTFHDANVPHPVCVLPNGFAFSHTLAVSVATYVSFYDGTGTCLGKNIEIDDTSFTFPAGATPVVHTYCGWTGKSLAVTRYAQYGGAVESRIMHCDHAGNPIGEPYDLQSHQSADMCAPAPFCDIDGMAFVCWFTSVTVQLVIAQFKTGCSSVIGVAQAAAANGGAVTVVGEGYFQLPSTQIFGATGQAFDQRNAPVVGCRGTVGGQIAVLFGWE